MKKIMTIILALTTSVLSGCSKNSSSVGIIGSSDGPTAIFITGNPFLAIGQIVVIIVLVVIAILLIIKRRNKK